MTYEQDLYESEEEAIANEMEKEELREEIARLKTGTEHQPVATEFQNNPTEHAAKESVSNATFVLLNELGQPLLGFTKGTTTDPNASTLGALLPENQQEVLAANFGRHAFVGQPGTAMLMCAEDAVSIRTWLAKQESPVNVIVAVLVVLPPKELLIEWLDRWKNEANDSALLPPPHEHMADKLLDYMRGAK